MITVVTELTFHVEPHQKPYIQEQIFITTHFYKQSLFGTTYPSRISTSWISFDLRIV